MSEGMSFKFHFLPFFSCNFQRFKVVGRFKCNLEHEESFISPKIGSLIFGRNLAVGQENFEPFIFSGLYHLN